MMQVLLKHHKLFLPIKRGVFLVLYFLKKLFNTILRDDSHDILTMSSIQETIILIGYVGKVGQC